jgi:hypothetical protein
MRPARQRVRRGRATRGSVRETHPTFTTSSTRTRRIVRTSICLALASKGSAVMEGAGFRAAAVRSVVTELTMLAKRAYPHRVCSGDDAVSTLSASAGPEFSTGKRATEKRWPRHCALKPWRPL